MLRSVLRSLPWIALWAVLALGLRAGLSRAGGEERRLAVRATASALGRVVAPPRLGKKDHPPAVTSDYKQRQQERILVDYVGNRREFKKDASPEYVQALKVGSSVMVYFDPADPGAATLDDPTPEQQRARNWSLAAFAIPIPVVLLLWSLFSRRRAPAKAR
jgi:hypothetical protein